MESQDREGDDIELLAVPLWPNAGKALGLGRNRTYDSAKLGEIPTLKFGRTYRVPLWWLRQIAGQKPAA